MPTMQVGAGRQPPPAGYQACRTELRSPGITTMRSGAAAKSLAPSGIPRREPEASELKAGRIAMAGVRAKQGSLIPSARPPMTVAGCSWPHHTNRSGSGSGKCLKTNEPSCRRSPAASSPHADETDSSERSWFPSTTTTLPGKVGRHASKRSRSEAVRPAAACRRSPSTTIRSGRNRAMQASSRVSSSPSRPAGRGMPKE